MSEIILCKECECLKQKSIVNLQAQTHGRARHVFYDEEGLKHIHDGSFVHLFFSCSKGHDWEKTSYGKCINEKCNWNGESIRTEN